MSTWYRRLFGSESERADTSVVPTGTDHDYRPDHCNRGHDWAVEGTGFASGTQATMRIEAWGARFRVGDRIVLGSPAETWWIVGITKDGNAWFPDRALLELAYTLEQG